MCEINSSENSKISENEIIDPRMIYNFRTQLPAKMPSKSNFSAWHFFKQCIGKDLSKVTMPVIFNEPISFLQRLSEYMEYSELIIEAVSETDPIKRMEKVSAFAVSVVSSNWERIGKPFNPLLGETYELHTSKFRWISEQVSHHPPISAFFSESPSFKFYGSIYPKLKLWGKSVEITPKGTVTLELIPWAENYTWQNVMCTVHNVIIGKIWIEHSGSMRIINHSNNIISEISFHSVGWFGRDVHRVEGDIYYAQCKTKNVHRKLYGKWTEALFSINPQDWKTEIYEYEHNVCGIACKINLLLTSFIIKKESKLYDMVDPVPHNTIPCDLQIPNQLLIWKVNHKPSYYNEYYNFTYFTMGLNQINEFIRMIIAPTDSRFRKDIRYMEEGLIDEASEAKNCLEEKQRTKYASIKSNPKKQIIKMSSSLLVSKNSDNLSKEGPLWFIEGINPNTNKTEWLYKGGYWERDWSMCPDIL